MARYYDRFMVNIEYRRWYMIPKDMTQVLLVIIVGTYELYNIKHYNISSEMLGLTLTCGFTTTTK